MAKGLRRFFGHLHTINKHKRVVMKHCFKLGLYKRGLLHDLSKYSPAEFWIGVKYFRGDISPNNIQRQEEGVATAWLHHKGRNKHHYEYWIDYKKDAECELVGMKMPLQYVLEMFCDRVAACKIYNKEKYHQGQPLEYYKKGRSGKLLHPNSQALLEKYLEMLAEKGEEYTFKYIKNYEVKAIRVTGFKKLVNKLKDIALFLYRLIEE